MCPSIDMFKKLYIGLLLLSGCSTTPVTVTGELLTDYPASLRSDSVFSLLEGRNGVFIEVLII